MTIEDLLAEGRKLTHDQVAGTVRQMAGDPRLGAVLVHVANLREQLTIAASDVRNAESPGKVAHYLGGVYSLDCLMDSFREMLRPVPRRSRGVPPEEDAAP